MGLYQNRIVAKAGTPTLTNQKGQSHLRVFDGLAMCFQMYRTWMMRGSWYPPAPLQQAPASCTKSWPSSIKLKQAAVAVG